MGKGRPTRCGLHHSCNGRLTLAPSVRHPDHQVLSPCIHTPKSMFASQEITNRFSNTSSLILFWMWLLPELSVTIGQFLGQILVSNNAKIPYYSLSESYFVLIPSPLKSGGQPHLSLLLSLISASLVLS